MTALTLTVSPTGEQLTLKSFRGIVAGYTGRDAAAVQHHIDELASIGVAPPPEVPMFYPVDAVTVSTEPSVNVPSSLTSGEVEPAYIRHCDRYFLGISSDHTDRDLEAIDIGESKRVCPKPLGMTVIEIASLNEFSLDNAVAASWVDGMLYQSGPLSGLRTPLDVITRLLDRTSIADDEDFVCLGGTLPLIGGTFTDGTEWRMQLSLPDGTTLDHTYTALKGQK